MTENECKLGMYVELKPNCHTRRVRGIRIDMLMLGTIISEVMQYPVVKSGHFPSVGDAYSIGDIYCVQVKWQTWTCYEAIVDLVPLPEEEVVLRLLGNNIYKY